MKKVIAIGVNGFTYRPIKNRTLNKREKLELALDVTNFKRAYNLNKLNNGQKTKKVFF